MEALLEAKGGFTYMNLFYKSKEEIYFLWYLLELQDHGIIRDFTTPKAILLYESAWINIVVELKSGRTKPKKHHLFHDVTYKGDFAITWNPHTEGKWFDRIRKQPIASWGNCPFIANEFDRYDDEGLATCRSLIDVKGGFKGAHNNSAITFPIISKILWKEKGIYVNKIMPKELFKKTFTPKRYFFTDKNEKPRTHWETFKDFKSCGLNSR